MMQRQSLTTYQQQSDDQPVFEQQLLWNSLKHNQLVKYFLCKWERMQMRRNYAQLNGNTKHYYNHNGDNVTTAHKSTVLLIIVPILLWSQQNVCFKGILIIPVMIWNSFVYNITCTLSFFLFLENSVQHFNKHVKEKVKSKVRKEVLLQSYLRTVIFYCSGNFNFRLKQNIKIFTTMAIYKY